mgnify:FL=1
MKNKFIGFGLIVLAVLILVSNIFNLNLSIWPLIPIAILAYFAVKDIYKKDYESAVLTGGISAIIANNAYHLLSISTGKLILVFVLLVFAVSFLFPKKEREDALNINVIVQKSLDEVSEQIKADLTKTKVAEPINDELKSEAFNLNREEQTIKTSLKEDNGEFTKEG